MKKRVYYISIFIMAIFFHFNVSGQNLNADDAKIIIDSNMSQSEAIGEQVIPEEIIVKAFQLQGWEWGGDWDSVKDYQHFEKQKQ